MSLKVSRLYCVDLRSVHMSGISNGGMFSYFFASRYVTTMDCPLTNHSRQYASFRSDRLATIGPVAASPLLGFGKPPIGNISVIDFHGINDKVGLISMTKRYFHSRFLDGHIDIPQL